MALEGGSRILRFLVLIFNFVFFIFGIVLFGVGIWGENKLGPYGELSNVNYATGPRVLIAVGIIIAVVAFFGCCGAWKENKCMLICFFALLFVLLILEITAGALAYSNKDKIEKELEKDIRDNLVNYPHKNKKPIDDMQSKLHCCGASSYTDWWLNPEYNKTASVPDSCCKTDSHNCGKGQLKNTTNIYKTGCYTEVKTLIEDSLVPIGSLAITILVIQILGMIFALVLICRIE